MGEVARSFAKARGRRVRCRGEGCDPDGPGAELRQLPLLLLGGGDRGRDGVGAVEQTLTGFGQGDAARAAQQQWVPDFAFEGGHVLADRRLCPAQRPGCRADRSGVGDRPEDQEASYVHGPKHGLWQSQ